MRVLLTSAGLETEKIKEYFIKMSEKDMLDVKALFIPTAAIDPGAIAVLPKCMNDLLKCGIQDKNIRVFDLHIGMNLDELMNYDVVYICGGDTSYLLERINNTGFGMTLMEYIKANGMVIGVSAGSLIFADNLPDNLGLIETKLDVHCPEGETIGKVEYSSKKNLKLTNTSALAVWGTLSDLEVIGE